MGRARLCVLVVSVVLSLSGVVGAEEPQATSGVLEGAFEIEVPAADDAAAPVFTLRGRIRITPDPHWRPLHATPPILHLIVVPWANVTIGENELGRVSSSRVRVDPGEQTILIEHPDYRPLRRRLRFLPGQTQRLVVDLAEEAILR